MKSIFFTVFLILSTPLHAAIEQASLAATTELSFEIEANSIWAFEVTNLGDEYEVAILSEDFSTAFNYGCHLHGSVMACHEEGGHAHKNNTELSELHLAEQVALARLVRQGLTLEALESYKVWRAEASSEHKEDHDHHAVDFWIKANYQGKTVYQQCHLHGDETDLSCHYRAQGQLEPQF